MKKLNKLYPKTKTEKFIVILGLSEDPTLTLITILDQKKAHK